ncbi:helix-turn-helix domain-containing protein, partial [Brachybacterium hainanense]
VRAADARQEETARDAEPVLRLIGRAPGERGPGQRRAVRAAREDPGARQSELAERLGVRQQTVSRALRTAGFHEEQAARPLAERLLAMIDLTSGR